MWLPPNTSPSPWLTAPKASKDPSPLALHNEHFGTQSQLLNNNNNLETFSCNICSWGLFLSWAAGVAQRPAALTEHGANNTRAEGSVPLWAIHLRVGLHDLCDPFQLGIFCHVLSVTLVVLRSPDSNTEAELVMLTLPLLLCPSLPWLGLPRAFCCPACHWGLRPSGGVAVTSKWHCYPLPAAPNQAPSAEPTDFSYLTTVPERRGRPPPHPRY